MWLHFYMKMDFLAQKKNKIAMKMEIFIIFPKVY